MAIKNDYKNYAPPLTGRKFRIIDNGDGTSSIEDVTEYVQVGDIWGAGDANTMASAINSLDGAMCEIYNGEVTIPASSWTNNMETARYEATVTNEYVRTDTDVDVWVSDAQSGKYSLGWLMPQDGSFTLYTLGAAPEEDIVLYISVLEAREI